MLAPRASRPWWITASAGSWICSASTAAGCAAGDWTRRLKASLAESLQLTGPRRIAAHHRQIERQIGLDRGSAPGRGRRQGLQRRLGNALALQFQVVDLA